MEFSLLGAAVFGVVGAYTMLYWEAKHGNADRCAGNLWDTALLASAAGLLIGRLIAMIADGINPLAHPGDIVIVRGGVSVVGAALGAMGVFLILSRREPVAMADGISAAALAGLAMWHTGCIVRAGCLGSASELPWAVAQPGSVITRHPVEIYAGILLMITALAVAAWKAYGRAPPGTPAAVALTAAAGIRLITEPLRPVLGSTHFRWYTVGLAVGLALTALSVVRSRARPRSDL